MGVISDNRHGRAKQGSLQLHRLYEFKQVFNLYLEGQTTVAHVTARARVMLQAGLPRLK
jgi:hypothetical protein